MKRQKQGSKIKRLLVRKLLLSSFIVLSISCSSDIETINALISREKVPDQTDWDVEMDYTDTAKLQLKFITPKVHQFINVEEPYSLFPLGITVYFYDDNEVIESVITANYAKYRQKQDLWEARDSVVAKNLQTGERIETEQLFWDATKHKIYSEVFTKIINEDGVYFGERGFEAAQDLSYYRLIGSKGTVRVKEDE